MKRVVVALPGDGIGGEVVPAALQVLRAEAARHHLPLVVQEYGVGGRGLEEYGDPLPDFVLEACRKSRMILLGAVGDDRFRGQPREKRPERALLQLRGELGLFANLRPVRTHPALASASPLKRERVAGVDILIVRELTGGIYFGTPRGIRGAAGERVAVNSQVYSEAEIVRIARMAFEAAMERGHRVTSVDKSNVLETSQLWREVVTATAREYPQVELEHLLVDNCAMQLIARPAQFDVLLTGNLFGDILSDEAAMLTGSIGMLPSASLGESEEGRIGLYEPVHGTAPDIAGKDRANPLATIASVAMLFRYSLSREDVARRIERAIEVTLSRGFRTPDLAAAGDRVVGTAEMTEQVLRALEGG